jgi:hypothetical protein
MKYALIGAALVATLALGTTVQAQEVVTNPGRCAQYYPNANCQNYGPGNPYRGSYQPEYGNYGNNSYAYMMHRHRHHHRHMH